MSRFESSRAPRLLALVLALAVALPASSGVLAQAQGDYTLTVQVREESRDDGDLIPDFQVQLLGLPTGAEGDAQQIAVATTDDQGAATFTGLSEGLYQVVNVPYEEGRACTALPSELVDLSDEATSGNAQVIVQCGSSPWMLLLLGLPAITTTTDTP